MSILVGPISGALVAGGVYYGFSNLISSRTDQHQRDLAYLTQRLSETPTLVQGPPRAASLIKHNDLASYAKAKWNQEIETLATGFRNWDRRAVDWARNALYGPATPAAEAGKKA
ncbi:hypothetical protein DFP72DRAFT_1071734 [Ephemerocybe angulata]|uniref:MICOS complex subunit MIC12 n=1 Tax=Ephemerocybe angulata TaxID=980116 RepID=A0A8H6M4H9_9AGAR|nr:hypothetical protein DFP72DRAFT_1071734 [Tulosesus angulatus]